MVIKQKVYISSIIQKNKMGIKKALSIAILAAMGFAGVSVLPNIINPPKKFTQGIECKSICVSKEGNCDGIDPRCVASDLSKLNIIAGDLESKVDGEIRPFNYINFESDHIPDMVKEAADYYNADPGFANYTLALANVESGFDPNAISYKDARGVMQVMLNTARIYDPDITQEELLKPEKNIPIGVAHFSNLVKEYGNYKLAIAAYHTGETNLNNAIGALKSAKDGNDHYGVFSYRGGKKITTRTIEVSYLRDLPNDWRGYSEALKKITGNKAIDTIDHVNKVWQKKYYMRGT